MLFFETRRHVGRRVYRKGTLVWNEGIVPKSVPGVVEAVPQRNRHPKKALSTDEPITIQSLNPICVSALHVGRMPSHLIPSSDEIPIEVLVPPTVSDIPLTTCHNLKRPITLLEEFHRVSNGARFTDQFTRILKDLDDLLLRRKNRFPRHSGKRISALRGDNRFGNITHDATGSIHHCANRKLQFAPPGHVIGVSEGAHHSDTGSFFGIR